MVEVTYGGKPLSPLDDMAAIFEQFQMQHAFKLNAEEWLRQVSPKLDWMKSLENLVFIKLGTNATFDAGERVISPLLDCLVRDHLFPRHEEVPLRRFWIQNFEVYHCPALGHSSPDSLQSYRSGDCEGRDDAYESFCQIEDLGGSIGVNFSHPIQLLQKLKYVSGTSYDDSKVKNAFQIRIYRWTIK